MAGWITHVATSAVWAWRHLARASPDKTERTRQLDQGRGTVLGIAMLAASVAGGILIAELVMQKNASALERVPAVPTIISA